MFDTLQRLIKYIANAANVYMAFVNNTISPESECPQDPEETYVTIKVVDENV